MAAAGPNQECGPLMKAAYSGDADLVKQLLRQGANVDASNQAGLQALHFAAKIGNVDVASELIAHGACVNVTSHKGNSPLHVAALLGHTEMVKLLLKHDADVNLQSDCNGDVFTSLYMAAQIGHLEIVMLLLAQGADPSTATKNGSTAKDVAYQQGFKAVAELLEEYEHRLVSRSTSELNSEAECGAGQGDRSEGGGGGPKSCGEGNCTKSCPINPSHQDIIPSPQQSPLKTKAMLPHNGAQ